MKKQIVCIFLALGLMVFIGGCEGTEKVLFEESNTVLAEKSQGQNDEYPRVVINEPENINAKEIAETFVKSYSKEISHAIVYI